MKKTFFIMAAIAAMACSCEPEKDCLPCSEENGTMEVSLEFDEEPSTKATTYVTAQTYEKQVNNVQILVFDSSGALNVYKDAGTASSGITINTTTGAKTVWAVVNGPSLASVTTQSVMQNTAVDLSKNSITASTGFVMSGSASVTVGSTTATATISVRRLVSRVALQKVTNSLPASYGDMTINNVFLSNVVGNQNIAGTAAISTWYNKMGRKSGATVSNQIIDGNSYLASCPTLTFKNIASDVASGESHTPSTPYLLYCYPNSTTTDVTNWSQTFSARKTRLVVTATIGGKKYYYPIVIDTPQRNTAYTVELTITGLGSPDPDTPVVKGTINATVSVQGWVGGAVYEETI